MELEIKHTLHFGDLKLKKLLKDYNNADDFVLFNNKSGERTLNSISNPKSKPVFEPSYVYRPEPAKLDLGLLDEAN